MGGGLRQTLRALSRVPGIAGTLLAGLVQSVWLSLRPHTRREVAATRRRWFAAMLRRTAVRVTIVGKVPEGPALVVANHVSWLDIPVIGTALTARFLSKHEIASWPVLGWLARRHGTLFIRRGAGESDRLNADLVAAFRGGDRVVIFPEATTSDGRQVLRFHPRLFEAARLAGVPILPVALHYPPDAGQTIADAAFFGDARLGPHLWQLLHRRETEVSVEILPLLEMTPLPSRDALAREARERIAQRLGSASPPHDTMEKKPGTGNSSASRGVSPTGSPE